MSDYFRTCASCKYVKCVEWDKDEVAGIKAEMQKGGEDIRFFPERNYICSNADSPLFEECVIGSWGCVFSSKLSPLIRMANGSTLEEYRKADSWNEAY